MSDRAAARREAAERRRTPLGLVTKSAYGAGQMVDAFVSSAINLFLFFYLTAVCGLSGALAGSAVFAALVVDAVVDPLVGSLSDNARFKAGRRHPFMIASLGPLALGLGLLFSLPHGLLGPAAFAYVVAISVLVRAALSGFMVPYAALGAELTDDYVERSSVVSYRLFFGTLGSVACMVMGALIFFPGAHGLSQRAAYAPFAWTAAAFVAVFGLLASAGTLKARDRLHPPAESPGGPLPQLVQGLAELGRNGSFLALFGCEVIYFVALGVSNTLTFHAYSFFWKLPQNFSQWVIVASCIGAPAGVLLNRFVSPRFEKRDTVVFCIIFSALLQAAAPLSQLLGHAPDGVVLQGVLLSVSAIVGAVITLETVAFYSMIADAADEHEHQFGARREGLYFAGLSFAIKASSGGGSFIAGLILDAIHFPAGAAAKGEIASVATEVATKLGWAFGPGCAIATVVSALPLLAYRLDRRRHAELLAALAAR